MFQQQKQQKSLKYFEHIQNQQMWLAKVAYNIYKFLEDVPN